mmetsp:Transcript_34914/g.112642  ORF Transcript_34914/g.112642 Transcript_34914/m.112642 type:complete len:221 (+) Transcript_34914:354-1016(+)
MPAERSRMRPPPRHSCRHVSGQRIRQQPARTGSPCRRDMMQRGPDPATLSRERPAEGRGPQWRCCRWTTSTRCSTETILLAGQSCRRPSTRIRSLRRRWRGCGRSSRSARLSGCHTRSWRGILSAARFSPLARRTRPRTLTRSSPRYTSKRATRSKCDGDAWGGGTGAGCAGARAASPAVVWKVEFEIRGRARDGVGWRRSKQCAPTTIRASVRYHALLH